MRQTDWWYLNVMPLGDVSGTPWTQTATLPPSHWAWTLDPCPFPLTLAPLRSLIRSSDELRQHYNHLHGRKNSHLLLRDTCCLGSPRHRTTEPEELGRLLAIPPLTAGGSSLSPTNTRKWAPLSTPRSATWRPSPSPTCHTESCSPCFTLMP